MESQLEFKQSQLELFNAISTRNEYLAEVRRRAIEAIGLPILKTPGTSFEKVVILLPDRELRGTPDNQQTRDFLSDRIIKELKEQVRAKSIIQLASEAVRIELGRWSPKVEYQCVATVWY